MRTWRSEKDALKVLLYKQINKAKSLQHACNITYPYFLSISLSLEASKVINNNRTRTRTTRRKINYNFISFFLEYRKCWSSNILCFVWLLWAICCNYSQSWKVPFKPLFLSPHLKPLTFEGDSRALLNFFTPITLPSRIKNWDISANRDSGCEVCENDWIRCTVKASGVETDLFWPPVFGSIIQNVCLATHTVVL